MTLLFGKLSHELPSAWIGAYYRRVPDLYEVAVLIGACFIVNYVTADSKTNWAEGATMVSFYVMIVRDLGSFTLSSNSNAHCSTAFSPFAGCLCVVLPGTNRKSGSFGLPWDCSRSVGITCEWA